MSMLRSEGHVVYGLSVNKTTLSPFDSKRWITSDGVNTLAYGHKNLKEAIMEHWILNISRRQLCARRHNHQLLADEPALRPIIEVV